MLDQWDMRSVDVENEFARGFLVQSQFQLRAFFLNQKFVPATAAFRVFDPFPDRKRVMPKRGEFTRRVPLKLTSIVDASHSRTKFASQTIERSR